VKFVSKDMGKEMINCKIVKNGVNLVKKVCKAKLKKLDHIDPIDVTVVKLYGCGSSKYLAKIRTIPPALRVLLDDSYRSRLYVIELNVDRLMMLSGGGENYRLLRNIVLYHELLHINPRKMGYLRGHTVLDFEDVIKTAGSKWLDNKFDQLPDILETTEKDEK
jgi:predicted metallopeptidase